MSRLIDGKIVPYTASQKAAREAEEALAIAQSGPTAEDVKAEAGRRIIGVLPEWKQRNLTAQAAILAEKGRPNWTAEELAAWDAGRQLWGQVALVRQASDVLEAMDKIPDDFADNKHWPGGTS